MPYAARSRDLQNIATVKSVVDDHERKRRGSEKFALPLRNITSGTLHQRPLPPSIAADRGPSRHFTNEQNGGSLLYTDEQRLKRDQSPWTLVQGVLAPVQFAIFLISVGLVVHFLVTGNGFALATGSIVVKTVALYAIMITGAIWEHEVFGRYLFARAFFWEDVFSMLVLTLHTAYLVALATGALSPDALIGLALAAYATYVVNAGQFVWKLRRARLQRPVAPAPVVGDAA